MVSPRRLFAASLLLALLGGCGHAGPMQVALRAPGLPTAMVAGQERAFGYDLARFGHLAHGLASPAHLDPLRDAPAQVDNRRYCSKVADQGRLGACTAFAVGRGMREYLQIRNGEQRVALSPLWLYYNERAHMGPDYVGRDSGSTITDGCWVLLHQGCATEASWPYQIPKFAVAPDDTADATAATGRLRRPQWIAGLADAKVAIAAGQPVAFAFKAYESLRTVGADGVMPMPKPDERLLGGHAVLAVGYDDTKQQLIVRNSWGAAWGDHGYFYMPYAFAGDSSQTMDFWTAPQ